MKFLKKRLRCYKMLVVIRNKEKPMPNYCTQCGIQIYYEADVCNDCLSQPNRQTARPFAEQTRTQHDFSQYQTQPLNQPFETQRIQPFHAPPHNLQSFSSCPYCGGSGGVTTKSTISTAGFIYIGVMFTFTFFAFLIFFPCAIIPFALLFLGLLFKETYFACVNCGQKVN